MVYLYDTSIPLCSKIEYFLQLYGTKVEITDDNHPVMEMLRTRAILPEDDSRDKRSRGISKWRNELSEHPDLTMEIVKRNPHFPWRCDKLYNHPNVNPLNYPNCQDYSVFSENPALEPEFVLQHIDLPWQVTCIFKNDFSIGKTNWIERKRLQIIKTLQIQRIWRKCTNNPQYSLCRRLILSKIAYPASEIHYTSMK